ncbi:hypothetical protein OG21DRAFT_1524944 [Imleria badia]|nr:hypothetical protein OG21DRAFT_1524944 [Imleria badia]
MAKKKAPAAPIPDVQWSDNMIWQLINQIERNENWIVLLGSDSVAGKAEEERRLTECQKTSGDSKVAVYQRIGAAVLPTYHTINTVATGDQVKRKYEHLLKKYKGHATRLRTTGEGVNSPDGADDDDSDEYFDCYVPASGPDATTTAETQSIWDEIVKAFPFFLALHRIFSSRPNVTPIAITTGVGPHRKKTVHFQAPSDDEQDLPSPAFTSEQHSQMLSLHQILEAERARHQVSPSFEPVGTCHRVSLSFEPVNYDDGGSPPWQDWDKENDPPESQIPPPSQSSSTPTAKCAPKPLSVSESVEKAKERISQERQMLLKEYEAGIWDALEYKEKLVELMARPSKHSRQAASGALE